MVCAELFGYNGGNEWFVGLNFSKSAFINHLRPPRSSILPNEARVLMITLDVVLLKH